MTLYTRVAAAALIAAAGLATLASGTAAATPTSAGIATVMYGDPNGNAKWWAGQSEGDCGLMTVAVVVGQLTGQEPSEPNIVALAQRTPSVVKPGKPIYTPAPDLHHPNASSGTQPEDMIVLLGKYGIHAHLVHGTPEAMAQDLAQGRGVIAIVNHQVMTGEQAATPQTTPNHVVVVTGIDTTAHQVHVSDTGVDAGRDNRISFTNFGAAWDTGHDMMIVTDETHK
jgi:hypothetical protein